ncbi:MAG: hypothetical protein ACQESG_00520 [Nanobdellota archaeon]
MEPYRVFVHLAGYNKKSHAQADQSGLLGLLDSVRLERTKVYLKRWLVKQSYGENLIDEENKALKPIDDSGKRAIHPGLEAVAGLGNSHSVIVGDRSSLESVIDDEVIEQGDHFLENLDLGYQRAVARREELLSQGAQVSDHIYFLFGDVFAATTDAIKHFADRVEEHDADLSVGICLRQENGVDDGRRYFNIRPWVKFADAEFRNSNIGALRVPTETRGIPRERYFLFSAGYTLRKLKNPLNLALLGKNMVTPNSQNVGDYPIDGKSLYIASSGLLKTYAQDFLGKFNPSWKPTLAGVEAILNRSFETEDKAPTISFLPADCCLEPDIDSRKDEERARKLVAVSRLQDVTYEDCLSMYGQCEDVGCKFVRLVGTDMNRRVFGMRTNSSRGKKDYRLPLSKVQRELDTIAQEPTKSLYFHPHMPPETNYLADLYHDMQRAYAIRVSDNQSIIMSVLRETTQKLGTTDFSSLSVQPLTGAERRVLYRSVAKINQVEGLSFGGAKYDSARADAIVRRYLENI